MHPLDDDADPRVRLAREATRVADRLRSLSLDRLDRPGERGERSPADRAREVSQRLADLAADAAGRRRRQVPSLPPHAAGDQLAVTAHDVLTDGDDRAVVAALDVLVALRRAL
ncbi:hypothetical protein [Angustibacter aerolatus]